MIISHLERQLFLCQSGGKQDLLGKQCSVPVLFEEVNQL